jgi:O-antigen/teichoic acid export membrane protein
VLVNVGIGLLTLFVILGLQSAGLFSAYTAGSMGLLLPVAVVVGGAQQTLGYCVLRFGRFSQLSNSKIAQASGYSATALAFGLATPLKSGLIVADIVGRFVAAVMLTIKHARWTRVVVSHLSIIDLRRVVSRYREFPLVAVPGGLINAAGAAITPILFFSYFEPALAGQYALVDRTLTVPVAMIGTAVSQVFTAELSSALRTDPRAGAHLYRRIVRNMAYLGLVPAALVGLLAPLVIPWLFGEQWRVAGQFARILAPLLFLTFVVAPVNMTIMLLGRQRTQAIWEITRLLAVVSVWGVITTWHLSEYWAIALHVAACASMYLLYLWLADRLIRRPVSA